VQEHPFRLDDWHRFLFGNASWLFLFEVLLRTSVTYLLIVVTMRLLGRRIAAQYTLFEISIVVTLAVATGIPLHASNRGVLPPLIIALVAVVLQRFFSRIGAAHRRIETLLSTDVSLPVRDGRFELKELSRAALPREKIYERCAFAACSTWDRLVVFIWSRLAPFRLCLRNLRDRDCRLYLNLMKSFGARRVRRTGQPVSIADTQSKMWLNDQGNAPNARPTLG